MKGGEINGDPSIGTKKIICLPTCLWFAGNPSVGGNYTTPTGDFSTLTLTSTGYTRHLAGRHPDHLQLQPVRDGSDRSE